MKATCCSQCFSSCLPIKGWAALSRINSYLITSAWNNSKAVRWLTDIFKNYTCFLACVLELKPMRFFVPWNAPPPSILFSSVFLYALFLGIWGWNHIFDGIVLFGVWFYHSRVHDDHFLDSYFLTTVSSYTRHCMFVRKAPKMTLGANFGTLRFARHLICPLIRKWSDLSLDLTSFKFSFIYYQLILITRTPCWVELIPLTLSLNLSW